MKKAIHTDCPLVKRDGSGKPCVLRWGEITRHSTCYETGEDLQAIHTPELDTSAQV